jgi:hypothetical protein
MNSLPVSPAVFYLRSAIDLWKSSGMRIEGVEPAVHSGAKQAAEKGFDLREIPKTTSRRG